MSMGDQERQLVKQAVNLLGDPSFSERTIDTALILLIHALDRELEQRHAIEAPLAAPRYLT